MAFYALGDLHLSHAVDKPMDVFGSGWDHHAEKIAEHWNQMVSDDDVVLIPGDISWAMTLEEARPDLDYIGRLHGDKVMIRGNHDYWWNGISKVRNALPSRCYAIQNDSLSLHGYAICGSRGWILPTHPKFTADDEVIHTREVGRLKMSLERAATYGLPIIAMLHYPPCGMEGEDTLFTEVLEAFQVRLCVYGHLHGAAHRFAFEGIKNGVEYRLVSADYVNFKPVLLPL
ncbi:metallophosphoesterase [Alicyclobacillus pomorum]|jgi:predicted phosphohydrolase|uniref:metallophosphoesterase n=1 Tax=Alicyclobacillus pomorum TaxID=204470 RepID=UPI000421FB70|nr:metallophosphoesterase [Alicyclobacillus pomorum]